MSEAVQAASGRAPVQVMEMIGKRLGKYTITEDLGKGAMAAVYKAREESSGKLVALKILPGQITRDAERLRRFKREYRILAELDHPNIIRLLDADEAEGFHFYTMEYLEHPTLRAVIRGQQRQPMPVPRAAAILENLLRGLEYIHARQVVHRDVKPANCYIAPGDRTILADFGLVKATAMTAITMAPSFIGTPEYAAPEQIMIEKGVDARSDLYQAGLMFYELLAGQLPFSDDLESIICEKCLQENIRSPREFNPALSPELEAFVMKATVREASLRHESATRMLESLRSLAL
jgi:serine/threonine-protein kinase